MTRICALDRRVMRATSRRDLLAGALAFITTASFSGCSSSRSRRFTADPFSLGVASGYPTPDSVVLWTRLAPSPFEPGGGLPPEPIPVQWELATDERMTRVVARGLEHASPEWAHSVHVEPRGLQPGRTYWYRFTAGGVRSKVGRTHTAPRAGAAIPRLKLAVASCQQYEHGYFSAYQHILKDDPDLIVHNGDYIYEASWGDRRVRHHRFQMARTLEEYRAQYALYKSDPDLVAAHAAVPWLVTWDDHEVANDYGGDFLSGVSPEVFRARRLAAYRAYYEHMPLPRFARPSGAVMRIYTARAFGDLAAFYMLDERQYRSPPACRTPEGKARQRLDNCAELNDPARTMLGMEQEAWLAQQFAKTRAGASARWNCLVQGVVMSYIDEDPGPGTRFWYDGWNGNPTGRQRLMNQLADYRVRNPVVLSGDVHAFIVSGLHRHPGAMDSPVIATELVATSISSQGTPQNKLDEWRAANPNLLTANGSYRGYLRLDLTPQALTADLVALDSALQRQSNSRTLQRYVIECDRPGPVAA